MRNKIYAAFAFIAAIVFGIFEFEKKKSAEALLTNLDVKKEDLKLEQKQGANQNAIDTQTANIDELNKEKQAADAAASSGDTSDALKFWNKK